MLMSRIDTWLARRRASGFSLKKYEVHLHRFAEFAAARGEDHIRAETAMGADLPARRVSRVNSGGWVPGRATGRGMVWHLRCAPGERSGERHDDERCTGGSRS